MRLVAAIAAIALAGCVTPSIPIPPPDPARMTFHLSGTTDTTAVLTYPPTDSYRDGIAYVYNRKTGMGVIQNCNADGSIGPTPPTPAKINDEIVVSVQVGNQTESSCIVLREGTQDPTQYCGF